jgi:hypothetical protein
MHQILLLIHRLVDAQRVWKRNIYNSSACCLTKKKKDQQYSYQTLSKSNVGKGKNHGVLTDNLPGVVVHEQVIRKSVFAGRWEALHDLELKTDKRSVGHYLNVVILKLRDPYSGPLQMN